MNNNLKQLLRRILPNSLISVYRDYSRYHSLCNDINQTDFGVLLSFFEKAGVKKLSVPIYEKPFLKYVINNSEIELVSSFRTHRRNPFVVHLSIYTVRELAENVQLIEDYDEYCRYVAEVLVKGYKSVLIIDNHSCFIKDIINDLECAGKKYKCVDIDCIKVKRNQFFVDDVELSDYDIVFNPVVGWDYLGMNYVREGVFMPALAFAGAGSMYSRCLDQDIINNIIPELSRGGAQFILLKNCINMIRSFQSI